KYVDAGTLIRNAVAQYAADVRAGAFPTAKESFKMDPAALAELQPAPGSRLARRHALGLDA
ncbi:MAG TPA: hypothetical protein VIH21_09170, partial [Dehalococcoidia bacterium]